MAKMSVTPLFTTAQPASKPKCPITTRAPMAECPLKIKSSRTNQKTSWTVSGPSDEVYALFNALEERLKYAFPPVTDSSLPQDLQAALARPVTLSLDHMMQDPYGLVQVKGLKSSFTGDEVAMSLGELKEMAADPSRNPTTQFLTPLTLENMRPSLGYAASVSVLISGKSASMSITSGHSKVDAVVEAAITAQLARGLAVSRV